MRGRKKKPLSLVRMEGNPGKRKLPSEKQEIKPTPEIPLCPDFLDDDAKKEWEYITPQLYRLGLLTGLDKAALAGYCQSYSWYNKFVKMEKYIEADKCLNRIKQLCAEFGMTASSRARMSVDGMKKEEDDMEKVLSVVK